MADWEDVRRLAMALPEVEERSGRNGPSWRINDKMFAWERPLRASDRSALGDAAPDGPILGLRVDRADKDAVIATGAPACFTIPHFDGYPAVLVQLDLIEADELTELVVDAWLCQAPKRVAKQFLSEGS